MKCKSCNAELENGDRSCRWCGYQLEKVVSEKKSNQFQKLGFITGAVGLVVVAAAILIFVGRPNREMDSLSEQTTNSRENITGDAKPTILEPSVDGGNTVFAQSVFYANERGEVFQTTPQQAKANLIERKKKSSVEPGYTMYFSGNKQVMLGQREISSLPEYMDPMQYDAILYRFEGEVLKTKIGNGVNRCKINENGTKIYFTTKSSALYVNNLVKTEEIAPFVRQFYISKDGNRVLFYDMANNLFIKEGNELKRLGYGVQLQYASEDLNHIYYIDDGVLYYLKNNMETIQIDSEVMEVLRVYQNNELYYTKSNRYDGAEYADGSTISEGNTAFALYYSKDNETHLVSDQCSYAGLAMEEYSDSKEQLGQGQNVMLYSDMKDVKDGVLEQIYLCVDGKVIGSVKGERLSSFQFDQENQRLYYINYKKYDSYSEEELYYIDLKEGGEVVCKEYAKGISEYKLIKGDVIFSKNNKINEVEDMYINNEKVDSWVDMYSFKQIGDTKDYAYLKRGYSTLTLCIDGVVSERADRVYQFNALSRNAVYYIKSDQEGKTSLYLYNGEKEDKLVEQDAYELVKSKEAMYGYMSWVYQFANEDY